jgi:hypothetical protein
LPGGPAAGGLQTKKDAAQAQAAMGYYTTRLWLAAGVLPCLRKAATAAAAPMSDSEGWRVDCSDRSPARVKKLLTAEWHAPG